MADTKISALTAATTPLAGTEVLPIVQSGVTKQVSVADLTAGRAVSALSLSLTNALTAANGGTGQSSYTIGDLLYASTTTALSKLADVATGNALISGGVGVAPSWGKIGLATHVSGTLGTANGGTGLTSFSSGGIVYASSTSALATSVNFTYSSNVVALNVPGTASYSATAAPTYNMGIFTDGSANSRYTSFAINSRGAVGQSQTCYITCVPGASDGDASLRFSTYGGYAVSEALNLTKDQNVSVTKGNIIQGTAAKGINFTANTPAAGMTSQLLNWYEEGTWTPVIGGATSETGQTYSIQSGYYTRVGNVVHAQFRALLSAKGTITGAIYIKGLPFTIKNANGGQAAMVINLFSGMATNWIVIQGIGELNTTTAYLTGISAAGAANNTQIQPADIGNTTQFIGSITYLI